MRLNNICTVIWVETPIKHRLEDELRANLQEHEVSYDDHPLSILDAVSKISRKYRKKVHPKQKFLQNLNNLFS